MTILTTQKITEVWPEKFDRFRDLIYIPLDLPPPPTIDIKKFINWVSECPNINNIIKCPNTGEKIFHFEEKGKQAWGYFPWIQVNAFHHGYSDNWIADFDKVFPEVVNYINLFPFNSLSGVTILAQKKSDVVPLHQDPDDWLGMRFYLKNEIKHDALYFTPTLKRFNRRIGTYKFDGEKVYKQDWQKYLDIKTKLYAKHPMSEHAWCLSSIRAAHGLDPIYSDEFSRITVLVQSHKNKDDMSAWNQDKLYDLLDRSLKKYSDYAIWWNDPTDQSQG
jgi:hypothetical protein